MQEVEGFGHGLLHKTSRRLRITGTAGNEISPELNAKVRALNLALQDSHVIEGIIETVPAYCSLLVCFDPLKVDSFR